MLKAHRTRRSLTSAALMVLVLSAFTSACIVQSSAPSTEGLEGTLESLEVALSYQATELAAQATMISYLATRGPAHTRSTPTAPVLSEDQFSGAVVIEDGICCVGAAAGEEIEIQIHFSAYSPFGEVTDMRVHASSGPLSPAEMEELSDWEAFRESRTISTTAAINWVGFYVNAQFRDSAGTISPVFWDDISIEGNPPTPTP